MKSSHMLTYVYLISDIPCGRVNQENRTKNFLHVIWRTERTHIDDRVGWSDVFCG